MVMKHHTSQEEIPALIIKSDKFRYVPEINVLFDYVILTTSYGTFTYYCHNIK